MKMRLLIALVCFGFGNLNAQTLNDISEILSTNCSSASCHNTNEIIDFSVEASDLYDRLVEQLPNNTWAANRGMELVDPGNPENSLLYRKINHGLYGDSHLPNDESGGANMPLGGEELADHEKELIRQWIYYNAPKFGTVVEPEFLEEYYAGGGLIPVEKPAAPPEGEGFQMHFGTFFLEPEEEAEWIYKKKLDNEEVEINRIELVMDGDFSHHFLLFQSPNDINQGDGILDVGFFDGQAITSDNKMVGGWAYTKDLVLPEGTAYTWEANSTLKFNYHIKNYSTTSILPCDVYINVFTQPVGTAIKEMHSEFYINTNFGEYGIEPGETKMITHSVPNSGFFGSENFASPPAGEPDEVHLWLIGGHTHQYGTDYDVYLKNDDGSIGEQIYEGFFDLDYEVNQGFYAWEEPAMRLFEPLVSFDRSVGLYTEAMYTNTGTSTSQFGLTTNDEMQGFFTQYLVGDISGLPMSQTPSGLEDLASEASLFELYPNPSEGLVQLRMSNLNEQYQLRVYDLMGSTVAFSMRGNNVIDLSDLPKGIYLVEMSNENVRQNRRVILH